MKREWSVFESKMRAIGRVEAHDHVIEKGLGFSFFSLFLM